jgi:lysophospholipase L1-like esterase
MLKPLLRRIVLSLLLFLPLAAFAALPPVDARVRYMALGDSLAAGYKAMPATRGYAYQLYLDEVFGRLTETVFANASVPGATSEDLLNFQLPQVQRFQPTVVTLSIGGNDLLTLLGAAPPSPAQVFAVINQFAGNLGQSLARLCFQLPPASAIYVQNLYAIPEIPPTIAVVPLFNDALEQVVANLQQLPACSGKTLAVADVFSAFQGQDGLLLIERFEKKGFANTFEVHPTNQGHRVIEDAFRAVIGR